MWRVCWIFPSIVLYFCSNNLRSFTLVANRIVFAPPGRYIFPYFCLLSPVPLCLTFNLFLIISMVFLDLAPVTCCVVEDAFSRFFCSVGDLAFGSRLLMETLSSDHR